MKPDHEALAAIGLLFIAVLALCALGGGRKRGGRRERSESKSESRERESTRYEMHTREVYYNVPHPSHIQQQALPPPQQQQQPPQIVVVVVPEGRQHEALAHLQRQQQALPPPEVIDVEVLPPMYRAVEMQPERPRLPDGRKKQ